MTEHNDPSALVEALLQDGSEAHLAELISAEATDVPLLAFLATACESAGDVERARRVAQRWAEVAPLDPYAHYKLALLEQRMQHYAEATRRLRVAAGLAGPDDDVVRASTDALQALDSIQMQQVAALMEVDVCFRVKSHQDPAGALEERGFSLSRGAVRHVQSMARAAMSESGRHVRPS